jgi:hypothetical protein
VRLTGRPVSQEEHPWLDCLAGDTHVIGADFFERLAKRRGWWIRREGASRGLLFRLSLLDGANCSADELSPDVVGFYEETSDYDFDVWSEWSDPQPEIESGRVAYAQLTWQALR